MDPFTPRLRFVDAVTGGRPRTWYDRCRIEPLEPLNTRVDSFIDMEALEAIATWQGCRKSPTEMAPEAYPSALEEQLREVEPQFILRNIGRAERWTDSEEPLEFERREVALGIEAPELEEVRRAKHAPPDLMDTMMLDLVQAEIAHRRFLFVESDWTRHFGRELKETITGPLWRHDPDAPAASSEGDEERPS